MVNSGSESDQELNEKLREIRDAVRHTVSDAQHNNPHELGAWAAVSRFLYYVLDLEPDALRYIRLHTEIFNGEPLNSLVFSGGTPEQDSINRYGYAALIEGLPESAILEEPDLPPFSSPLFQDGKQPMAGVPIQLGFDISGRRITPDLVRYQSYFRNLHSLGILAEIEKRTEDDRFVFFEIGAGYGSLAYQLAKRNRGRMSCIIVDLPLMLIFTACYMAVNLPDLNVFIFDPANPDARPDTKIHDLILVPNYRLDVLEGIDGIDLAFNSLSLQEMAETQIDEYLDFMKRHVRGGFYYHGTFVLFKEDTVNRTQNIAAKISESFAIHPSFDFFTSTLWKKARSGAHGWPVTLPYEFYATQKDQSPSFPRNAKLRIRLADGANADVTMDGQIVYPTVRDATVARSSGIVMLGKRIVRRILRIMKWR